MQIKKYLIEHTLFADSLISILLRIDKPDNARIFIKPHPKEPKKILMQFKRQ